MRCSSATARTVSRTPSTPADRLFVVTYHLVFLGSAIWVLTAGDPPNLAVFALTVSGIFVFANLIGAVRVRRRERDPLGL